MDELYILNLINCILKIISEAIQLRIYFIKLLIVNGRLPIQEGQSHIREDDSGSAIEEA